MHEVREATEEAEGRNSVEEIGKNFFPEIEKVAENLVKYQKFKEKVKAKPLFIPRPTSIQTASKYKASRRVMSSEHAISMEQIDPRTGEAVDALPDAVSPVEGE